MELLSILGAAFRKRCDFFSRTGDTCFRIFNSTADGLEGLTIDLYGEYLLGQSFHDKVKRIEDEVALASLELCAKMGKKILGVLWKDRTTQPRIPVAKMRSRLLLGQLPEDHYTVIHNGMVLLCDVRESQNTGVFMDMREVRTALLKYYPAFTSMLNLFSYTGAFAVHALLGGVKNCINVDSSRSAHNRAKENYRLNGLVPDDRDFIAGDAETWMKIFMKKKRTFSFIVYDPPTFSRAKGSHFSVRRDFRRHCAMMGELARGGHVLTAMNTISITKEEYFSFHPKSWRRIFFMNEAPDFRFLEDPYLKVALWRVP